jgi:hypothetical protein
VTSSFEIVNVAELSTGQLLEVINTAFGRSATADWYRWKHHEGPWGPSVGVAAVDRRGPIGIRLLLPWRLRRGEATFTGHRATEAATVPRAQGRGVFTALNRWMMEEVASDLIFSTPNLNSRGGYLKLGWQEIARVPHRWEVAWKPRSDAVVQSTPRDVLRTDWDRDALQWRNDPRSGHDYQAARADDAVLYYRVLRRWRVPVVAPMGSLGDPEQQAHLWREMLARTQARLVLRPASQPAPEPHPRLALERGESLVLGWWSGSSALALEDAGVANSIPWSAADIEGVI